MPKPNFFIIGAPKCGTTSLAHWLSEHPAVFMPKIKELDFFNTDIRKTFVESMDDYLAHFRHAAERHTAIGEASTGYLRSHSAVPAIERAFPGCRYIVCLRNPAKMAPAWHQQMLRECWEDVHDFETAWSLQEARRNGEHIPATCAEPANLQYAEVCALGSQVERLLATVDAARVHFVLLEELRDHPAATYGGVLDFLGLADDGREHFPALNVAARIPAPVSRAIRRVSDFKRRHHIGTGLGMLNALSNVLARPQRQTVDRATQIMLRRRFAAEVEQLQQQIGRSLTHWQ